MWGVRLGLGTQTANIPGELFFFLLTEDAIRGSLITSAGYMAMDILEVAGEKSEIGCTIYCI